MKIINNCIKWSRLNAQKTIDNLALIINLESSGGWVGGWVGGLKAVLRIAYSNNAYSNKKCQFYVVSEDVTKRLKPE